MGRQLLILACEICGEKFEARARRKVVHCRKCAEKLRREGRGPVQIGRKPDANEVFIKFKLEEIDWQKLYYI